MRQFADQILACVPGHNAVLGTDGYGLSDTRKQLRNHFEVHRGFIAVATLEALADQDHLQMKTVSSAIRKYQIDPERPDPASL